MEGSGAVLAEISVKIVMSRLCVLCLVVYFDRLYKSFESFLARRRIISQYFLLRMFSECFI